MFSKSIRATVKYETPQTHNWNCERKAGSLNINKVPELDHDQDASANMASWENCNETFWAWASVRKQGCLRSSLLVLILWWFLVWLPGISVESNIYKVSFGFFFHLGHFIPVHSLYLVSPHSVYHLCLSLVFPGCCFHCCHHLRWGVWLQSPGIAGTQEEAVKSVCCSTLRKRKCGKHIMYFWKHWNE